VPQGVSNTRVFFFINTTRDQKLREIKERIKKVPYTSIKERCRKRALKRASASLHALAIASLAVG
jgi:hypothetical protein